jgi:RND family efflux transporter MFP subunit
MRQVFVKYSVITALLIITIGLQSCLREEAEPPKGMAQLHEEEGLPVTTQKIVTGSFESSITFNATLKGSKESVETAKVGDKIIKINASVGSYVKKGDVIVEFPNDNPALQYEQAKAGLEIAKKTFKRMEELLKAGEISQQQYDQVETEYIVAKQNFDQLNQILNVQAPIDGTIVSIPFREGDVPKMGDVLFTVAQMNSMITKVNITDKEMQYVKKGMPALVEWNGEDFKGRVKDIDLAMNPHTRAFPVEVEVVNKNNMLKSGMLVDVSLMKFAKDSVIVVPKHLIKTDDNGEFVFIAKNGMSKKVNVETGTITNNDIEIVSGLNVGDELINCCMNMLEDGIKIKVTNQEGK